MQRHFIGTDASFVHALIIRLCQMMTISGDQATCLLSAQNCQAIYGVHYSWWRGWTSPPLFLTIEMSLHTHLSTWSATPFAQKNEAWPFFENVAKDQVFIRFSWKEGMNKRYEGLGTFGVAGMSQGNHQHCIWLECSKTIKVGHYFMPKTKQHSFIQQERCIFHSDQITNLRYKNQVKAPTWMAADGSIPFVKLTIFSCQKDEKNINLKITYNGQEK